jgi:hypothetical protein
MSVNARGVVVLTSSLAGLALTSALVFWPSHPHAPPPVIDAGVTVSVDQDAGASSADAGGDEQREAEDHVAVCDDLAKRYRLAWWSDSTGCAEDSDCVAEPRGGVHIALDGCARFGNRSLGHGDADDLAAQWRTEACAWPPELAADAGRRTVHASARQAPDCAAARAQCREQRCVEVPPSPVPKTWQRLSLPGIVSVFAPPDCRETPIRSINATVRVFDGEHRMLRFVADVRGSTPELLASAPDASDAGVTTRERLDGHWARVTHVVNAAPLHPRGVWRVAFEEHWELPAQGLSNVALQVTCDDDDACTDVPTIVHTIRFMASAAVPATPQPEGRP